MQPSMPKCVQTRQWCRRSSLKVQALVESDASIRVRGPVKAVFNYVSDFSRLNEWHPGVLNMRVTRGLGRPLDLRHQFEATQQIAGFKVNTLYEVVDLHPGKKIVYSCGSDLHVGTQQLVFMPDPNDAGFTNVRYMTRVELTEWRRALTPVVSGFLKKLPEQGMQRLGSLLNSAQSPIPLEPVTARRGGTGSTRGPSSSGASWGFNVNNLFGGMQGMIDDMRESRGRGGTQTVAEPARAVYSTITAEPQLDVLGYYATLGLDGKLARSLSEDDIKSAFRRAAQTMHPDKFSRASNKQRLEAESRFKQVQVAYEVLRDPTQRRLYDLNELQQLEQLRSTV